MKKLFLLVILSLSNINFVQSDSSNCPTVNGFPQCYKNESIEEYKKRMGFNSKRVEEKQILQNSSGNFTEEKTPIKEAFGFDYDGMMMSHFLTDAEIRKLKINTNLKDYVDDYQNSECQSAFEDRYSADSVPIKLFTKKYITFSSSPRNVKYDIKNFNLQENKILEISVDMVGFYDIKKVPININVRKYSLESKIPILGITTDTCTYYQYENVVADFSEELIDETKAITDKNLNLDETNDEPLLKLAINRIEEIHLNQLNNRVDLKKYGEFASHTESTYIEVLCSRCENNKSKVMEVDLIKEKNKWLADTKQERLAEDKRKREEQIRIEKEQEAEKKRRAKIEKLEKESQLRNTSYSSLPNDLKKDKIKLLKEECSNLGFKKNSDDFKACVVELMN